MGAPLERLAIDIMGPLPLTKKKNSYLMVAGDYFTKWIDAIPIKNQKADTIVQKLITIYSPYGNSFRSGKVLRVENIQRNVPNPGDRKDTNHLL